MHTDWYKKAVVYQIYPRSFCDSNGDGFGDIKGITSKLDYLKELGVNCVWLSPVYDSPQEDNGYDISDYYNIYPPFGTIDDFKEMLDEMHKRGIKLIMDLVVNHSSSEAEWFKKATSSIDSEEKKYYKDFYIIREGKKGGKKPPNNWTGFFGGSTWERINGTNEYYLHLFAKGQPDLNWENENVRKEVVKILKFWLDMGVDGFRCDVINLISKKQDFKSRFPSIALCGKDAYINGPRLHEYLHYLYEEAYSKYDVMTVGETALSKMKDVKKMISKDREELDMVFNFDHTDTDNFFGVKYLYRKFKLNRFKKRLSKWQYGLEGWGWNSLFIENHDQRRSSGRFGTTLDEYKTISSKSLATAYFLLKGTPFIYQGQEIGMENFGSTNINDYQDVEIKNMYKMAQSNAFIRMLIKKHLFEVSRDNARTPMQWDNSKNAGFSSGTPWLQINSNKDRINVKKSLEDENSLFYYYKKLIEIRKEHDAIINGKYKLLLKNDKNIFSYLRTIEKEEILVISSFSRKVLKNKIDTSSYKLLLSNYEEISEDVLKPFEARVYIKEL